MRLPIFQVDAFCDQLFSGNPAAVCPLDDWLADELLLKIAMENNLSETAFFLSQDQDFHIRWFTPGTEVDLCGHATLATAHVLFNHLHFPADQITFHSKSGPLSVIKNKQGYTMNFPADKLQAIPDREQFEAEIQLEVKAVFRGRDDYLVVVDSQQTIEQLQPNLGWISQLDSRGMIFTAPGDHCDFVSRCFFPQAGVDEDPVTGSAHTSMTPYWAKQLGKTNLTAQQLSTRGGQMTCQLKGDRVLLSGKAQTYLKGEIYLPVKVTE
ncbi:MAG: PhzF family phenazine biosynthesis protein [Bacteroidota bacterium]